MINETEWRNVPCPQVQLGDEAIKTIFEPVKTSKELKAINLSNNNFSEKGLKAIFDAVTTNPNIKNLSISGNSLSEEGVAILEEFLRKNSTLEVLNVENCSLKIGGVSRIFGAIAHTKFLKKLYIGGNDIGNEQTRSIFQFLEENASLVVLALNNTEIGTFFNCNVERQDVFKNFF